MSYLIEGNEDAFYEIVSPFRPELVKEWISGCLKLIDEYGKEKAIQICQQNVRETGNKIREWHSSRRINQLYDEIENGKIKVKILKLMKDKDGLTTIPELV